MSELIAEEMLPPKEELRKILLEIRDELNEIPLDDVLAMSQVAEKAWVAYVTYIKMVAKKPIQTHREIIAHTKALLRRDPGLKQVWLNADGLHRFHYIRFVEDLHSGLETIRDTIIFVMRELRKRLKGK